MHVCSKKNIAPDLETLKNRLLAAVYKKEGAACVRILENVSEKIVSDARLPENDEKHTRQILMIFKRFCLETVGQRAVHAQAAIKRKLLHQVRTWQQTPEPINWKHWQKKTGLLPDQIDLVMKTAMNFQLTTGCSHFCTRCNEWALPGVRARFTFSAVTRILDYMAAQDNTEISLYAASDPLDWQDNEADIRDIVRHAGEKGMTGLLLSKLPKGKTSVLERLLNKGASLSISVTTRNKKRIRQVEKALGQELFKQHDTDDLLIPAGRAEDFATVKPSITDGYGTEITPDGAFIVIPTFTSALHPFGHQKLPVTCDTDFFPEKQTGRNALLVDYFKPLKGYDLSRTQTVLPCLLDVQVESIILDSGRDELTPPGMRSVKEYLEIFDAPARLRRKNMTRSVLKKLKMRFLSQGRYADLAGPVKMIYRKKIERHLALCRPRACQAARKYALSFFLAQVDSYTRRSPEKLPILSFLIKDEISACKADLTCLAGQPPADRLDRPDPAAFGLFRACVISLVLNGCDPAGHIETISNIRQFIRDFPARYDADTDDFVRQPERRRE